MVNVTSAELRETLYKMEPMDCKNMTIPLDNDKHTKLIEMLN